MKDVADARASQKSSNSVGRVLQVGGQEVYSVRGQALGTIRAYEVERVGRGVSYWSAGGRYSTVRASRWTRVRLGSLNLMNL